MSLMSSGSLCILLFLQTLVNRSETGRARQQIMPVTLCLQNRVSKRIRAVQIV